MKISDIKCMALAMAAVVRHIGRRRVDGRGVGGKARELDFLACRPALLSPAMSVDGLEETGHPIGQPFGYHWIGYYTPDDIAAIKRGRWFSGGYTMRQPARSPTYRPPES